MSRFRTGRNADPGQVYAVLWVEFHVDCASEDCDEHILVSALGECDNVTAAEKRMKDRRTSEKSDGWVCKRGRWYCPKCAKGGA